MERIERSILLIRGQKVMLDSDLAELYGVTTSRLIEAVKRQLRRFPADFMFQLSIQEVRAMRSQFAISNVNPQLLQVDTALLSQSVISNSQHPENAASSSDEADSVTKRGGRRILPYVFTEQGVAMLSSVLNSQRAVDVNIEIMRAFVRLRQLISSHADLARKLEELERKYDGQFKVVFEAIKQLMAPPMPTKKQKIGFGR